MSQARLMLHGCVTSRCARPAGGRHGRTTRAPCNADGRKAGIATANFREFLFHDVRE